MSAEQRPTEKASIARTNGPLPLRSILVFSNRLTRNSACQGVMPIWQTPGWTRKPLRR